MHIPFGGLAADHPVLRALVFGWCRRGVCRLPIRSFLRVLIYRERKRRAHAQQSNGLHKFVSSHFTCSQRHALPKGVVLTTFLNPSITLPTAESSPGLQPRISVAPTSTQWSDLFVSDKLWLLAAAGALGVAAWAGAASATWAERSINSSILFLNSLPSHSKVMYWLSTARIFQSPTRSPIRYPRCG